MVSKVAQTKTIDMEPEEDSLFIDRLVLRSAEWVVDGGGRERRAIHLHGVLILQKRCDGTAGRACKGQLQRTLGVRLAAARRRAVASGRSRPPGPTGQREHLNRRLRVDLMSRLSTGSRLSRCYCFPGQIVGLCSIGGAMRPQRVVGRGTGLLS